MTEGTEDRPSKRARGEDDNDETSGSAQSTYLRDKKFWFPDGSIILVSKAPRVGFCVHMSILSGDSEFFRDMFNLALPEHHKPAPQEVPLDDCSEDIGLFLQYLYTPSYMSRPFYPFVQISGLLRMSTKYLCHNLRSSIVAQLAGMYPTNLVNCRVPRTFHDIALAGVDAVTAINAARESNVPEILPIAFYLASLIPLRRIVSVAASLSPADRERLYVGRARLTAAMLEQGWASMWSESFTQACDHDSCLDARTEVLRSSLARSHMAHATFMNGVPHQVVSAVIAPGEEPVDGQVCFACWKKWAQQEAAAYNNIWKQLPELFDLV